MEQAVTRRNVLVTATLLGLIAACLVYVYIKRVPPTSANVPVATAIQDIAPRTILEPGMVEVREMPANTGQGACASVNDCVGKVAVTPLTRGQAIMPAQVQEKSVALGLAYSIPQGMRAVTVALDPIIGVAGFLKPGDHVDVLATFTVNEGTVTKTVLQNVVLLATGSQLYQNAVDVSNKAAKAEQVPNATLAVDPRDAERLTLAESKGKLRLALRGVDDIVREATQGVTSRQLIGSVPSDVPQRAAAVQKMMPAQTLPLVAQRPVPIPRKLVTDRFPPDTAEIMVVRGAAEERVIVPNRLYP